MPKVENNLGDLTSPSSAFRLSSLSSPTPFFAFLFHPPPLHLPPFATPPTPLHSLLSSSLLSCPLPPEWPDAGNFTTVELFTFLQSWECMNIYDAGLSLWGICLYSLLILVCVHSCVHNIHNISLNCGRIHSWILCVHQPYIFLCVFHFHQQVQKM